MSERRSGSGPPPYAQRPDPATFEPQACGPIGFYERFSDAGPITRYPVESSGVFHARVPAAPSKPPQGLRGWFDKLQAGPKGRANVAREAADFAERTRASLWGLVVGWCAAENQVDASRSVESLLRGIEYSTRGELDLQAFAEVLRGKEPPGADSVRTTLREGTSLLGPAMPLRAVARGTFAPTGYFAYHLKQLLLPIPWAAMPAGVNPADFVAAEAPALDGLLACRALSALVGQRIGGSTSSVEQSWAAVVAFDGRALEGADDGHGDAFDRRFRKVTTSRTTPLVAPSSPADVVQIALWANLGAKSYRDVIEAAISLGGDTVATAAAAGAVAGEFGLEGNSSDLRARVPDAGRVESLARDLALRFDWQQHQFWSTWRK